MVYVISFVQIWFVSIEKILRYVHFAIGTQNDLFWAKSTFKLQFIDLLRLLSSVDSVFLASHRANLRLKVKLCTPIPFYPKIASRRSKKTWSGKFSILEIMIKCLMHAVLWHSFQTYCIMSHSITASYHNLYEKYVFLKKIVNCNNIRKKMRKIRKTFISQFLYNL